MTNLMDSIIRIMFATIINNLAETRIFCDVCVCSKQKLDVKIILIIPRSTAL